MEKEQDQKYQEKKQHGSKLFPFNIYPCTIPLDFPSVSLFPEAEEMVRTRFQQYHRNMTLNNLSQAMFTADSTLLMNPNGTAPGAIVPMGDGKVVIHLPGPPCELEPMFTASVEPYLMARSGRALVSRYVRTSTRTG